MNLRTLALVLTLGAAFAAYAQATPERIAPDICVQVSSGLIGRLKSGLKPKARGRLGRPAAVKSRQLVTNGPHGFRKGVYFVSARVRGFGIATWAADARAFKSGLGFVAGVGPVARRVSNLGADIPPNRLKRWHLHEETHGYAASRRCGQ
jgi:hypothetical protein